MLIKTKIVLYSATSATSNPFYESTFKSFGSLNWMIAALFILLSIVSFSFINKTKNKMKVYKKRQLKKYNENRPNKRDITDYSKTNLYLPFFERIKYTSPFIFGVLFLIIAITFMTGATIQTL